MNRITLGVVNLLWILLTFVVFLVAQKSFKLVEDYYYDPWIESYDPVQQSFIMIKDDKGVLHSIPDSLEIVTRKTEWELKVVIFKTDGSPDTVVAKESNLIITEKTSNRTQTLQLPGEYLVYRIRKVVKGVKK